MADIRVKGNLIRTGFVDTRCGSSIENAIRVYVNGEAVWVSPAEVLCNFDILKSYDTTTETYSLVFTNDGDLIAGI